MNRTPYGWIQLLHPLIFVFVSLSSSRVSTSPFPQSPHLRSARGNRKQWIRLPTTPFSLLTSQQIARYCPVASTGMRLRACEGSWAHVCSSFTWPPSVSHSLQTFSPLADSRSCEIDSCHMFDHMALSRVRGRKVCRSCLTVPRARDKHWRGKYEALLTRRLRLIGVSCSSVPRFQVPSLHSTSLQSELTSSS